MEEAVQKLDEQLDQLGNSLRDDSLTDDAKKNLLPFVVEVARWHIEERGTKFIEQGLEWARVALSIASNHERAKLLEVDAIDKLDNKHVRPQPLGLAIDKLKGVLKKRQDEYGQKAAAILNLKKKVNKDVLHDTAYAQVVSLRARYCQQIEDLLHKDLKVHSAHSQGGEMKIVRNVGKRTKRIVPNFKHVTLNSLGLEDESMTVSQALSALRGGQGKGMNTPSAQKLKKFMCLVGAQRPAYSLDFLKQHDAFRGSSVDSQVSVVSWNAQLMNIIDGPSEACIKNAIKWKAENIGRVVKKPGAGIPLASLLVIQEAPGPQLRECKEGTNRRMVADEKLFTKALEDALPAGFMFAEVALKTKKNKGGKEMGEDHIYGWHKSAMTKVEGPEPLPEPEGEKWVRRAPSYAIFNVKKWGASLLVVSVHAKSVENNSTTATENDVGMIGRAVLALQAKLQANNAAVDSVLIVGDFNLPPDQAAAALSLEGHMPAFGSRSVATNIWRFNGTGDEEQEGHAYDHGSVWARPGFEVCVSAELASASKKDVEKTHGDMKKVAGAVLESLAKLEISTAATKQALSTIEDGKDGKDGVPSRLRQIFQKEVKLRWSDHLPIVLTITMLKAGQAAPVGAVEEEKGPEIAGAEDVVLANRAAAT